MKSTNKKSSRTRTPPILSELTSTTPAYSQQLFIYIFLFLFSFLLYANTLHHEYALDDAPVLSGNQYVQQGFKGIPSLMTTDLFAGFNNNSVHIAGGRYRPLTLVSYAIEYQFFGLNPGISHFINIFMYALIALLLYRTLITMIPSMPSVALVTTLLFIAHPVHSEVVANIKSRDELFSLLWFLMMMLSLFSYVRNNKFLYIVAACSTYFLSLMSKENGITFVVIIPLSLYLFSSLPMKKIFYLSLPFFFVSTGYYFLRSSLVHPVGLMITNGVMDGPNAYTSLAEKLATTMHVLGKYLLLLVYPNPLSSDYTYNEIPAIGWSNWKALLSSAIYLSMIVYAIVIILRTSRSENQGAADGIHSSSIIAYGILFFIISLFLVSNILFSIGAPMGERFLFLPSVGFCLAVAVLINKATENNLKRRSRLLPIPTAVTLGAILILFSFKTISRNPDWKNNATLFAADVYNAPNSAKLHYEYGNVLYSEAMNETDAVKKQYDIAAAKSETMRTIEINPDYYQAYYNLGLICQEEGNADSSIYYLRIVMYAKPGFAFAYSALGTAFGKMKQQYDSAIYYLKIAVQLDDKLDGAYQNLGVAYALKNDMENAIPNLEKAVEFQPKNASWLMNLSIIYGGQGEKQKSQMYYDRAVAIDSSLKK